MQIIYHLGVHCTDEERLLRCLLKNRGALSEQGIAVPGPARYRTLLRDTAMQLRGQPASEDTQLMLIDQMQSGDPGERLVLSWENFLGYAQSAVTAQFYAAGPERMAAFTQVFPQAGHEFHLAIRNPATFIPAIFHKQRGRSLEEFMAEVDPRALRWSDLIARLRQHNPNVPVTVWCDEDTPLLWPEVIEAVAGHAPGTVLEDRDELLATILSAEGMTRMNTYLAAHPPQNPLQRRRIVSAFLDKFALPDRIEMELEMPGWTETLVDELTHAYDLDVSRIMALPGVRFLAP